MIGAEFFNNDFLYAAALGTYNDAYKHRFDKYSYLKMRKKRLIPGFCIGGNYGTSIVYCSEMVPANRRSWNMFILEMFWTAGSVYEVRKLFRKINYVFVPFFS